MMRRTIVAGLAGFILLAASAAQAQAAGVSSWLCDITGWFFCGLERAGLVRAPRPTDTSLALARFDLRSHQEDVLIADCSDCRSIATLTEGDLLILRRHELQRWNDRQKVTSAVLKRDDLADLLGRYPNDPEGILVAGNPARDGVCPAVFRLDLRSDELRRLDDPATGHGAAECPWLLAGPRADQYDRQRNELVLARGGSDPSTPSLILVEDLKSGATHRLSDDPDSPLNDGRSRYQPIWTENGNAIVYLREQ
jgi:hypothetical protein